MISSILQSKNICIVTGSRADYGLLSPLINALADKCNLQLVVTGSHLSERYGLTYRDIESDGNKINTKINIIGDENDAPVSITHIMGRAIILFGEYFSKNKHDILIILGDRYEIHSVCTAAVMHDIPIAHIHGGELTVGAVDDFLRHSITKMSSLHFTSCETYRQRVIQMGEQPDCVYNTGALGLENINKIMLLSKEQLSGTIQFKLIKPFVLVTFHSVTMERDSGRQYSELLKAIRSHSEYHYIFTMANADVGGCQINSMTREFIKLNNENNDYVYIKNLGQRRYLSALKHCDFVIGNSSSGIIEAGYLGTPSINVGNRQRGRITPGSVIHCEADYRNICEAIEKVKRHEYTYEKIYPYGDGNVSGKIITALENFIYTKTNDESNIKIFYDIGGIK